MNEFLTDIETLRRNARAHIEEGPITEEYGADRERVISVLNEVFATELVCVLRFKRPYYTAEGLIRGRSRRSSSNTPATSRATPIWRPPGSSDCRGSPTSR